MTDPVIAQHAAIARALVVQHIAWSADRLRLALGQVEALPRPDYDSPIERTLRRAMAEPYARHPEGRTLPVEGGLLIIRDVPVRQ